MNRRAKRLIIRGVIIGVCISAVGTILVWFMCVLGVFCFPGALVSKYFGLNTPGKWFAVAFPVNAIVYGAVGYVFAWAYVRQLPKDPKFCRRCEYDLTGNVSLVCPECGTPVVRRVSVTV